MSQVYIVYKGEFELSRQLKKIDKSEDLYDILGNSIVKPNKNVLARKLYEIADIPGVQRLAIFGRGSLLGEEDLLKSDSYSCVLTCISDKGTLLKISEELFELIK